MCLGGEMPKVPPDRLKNTMWHTKTVHCGTEAMGTITRVPLELILHYYQYTPLSVHTYSLGELL